LFSAKSVAQWPRVRQNQNLPKMWGGKIHCGFLLHNTKREAVPSVPV